jgi:replicative DNA helicase
MTFRKNIEDKILFILFTYRKEIIGDKKSETAFDIIRKHGLKFEDFSDPLNQALYKSIQNQLYSGLSDIDYINIVSFRPKEYKVFEQQANEYLMHINNLITTNYASFSELDKMIYKLKEFNLQDFWRFNAQKIVGTNFEQIDIVSFGDDIVSKYQEFYQRLMSGVLTKNSQANNITDELERKMIRVASGERIGVPIHMESFQTFFGGWLAPDLIIIGARPSMGKTSFVLACCWESAKVSNIAFFTYEMSVNQLTNKIACNLSGIEYNKIERAQLTPDEFLRVKQSYDYIRESKLNIYGIEYNKIEQLKIECRRLHRLGLLELVVIDYLQLMKSDQKHASREQEVSNISRELKLLCIELNVPIIALSQLGRASENGNNKRPGLADLRESGAIEQDADIVAFLFREAYYYDKNISVPYETKFHTEFIVAKGRNVGTTTLYFFNDVLKAEVRDSGGII